MENAAFHIILADDDEGDRLLFQEAVEELAGNPHVHVVNDGLQLLAYLDQKDAPTPDLLFLDLNMPRKNGIECLKAIRGNPKRYDLPIAIYSTSAAGNDVEDAFRHGANMYIAKPNDFYELKDVLAKAVDLIRQNPHASLRRADFVLTPSLFVP